MLWNKTKQKNPCLRCQLLRKDTGWRIRAHSSRSWARKTSPIAGGLGGRGQGSRVGGGRGIRECRRRGWSSSWRCGRAAGERLFTKYVNILTASMTRPLSMKSLSDLSLTQCHITFRNILFHFLPLPFLHESFYIAITSSLLLIGFLNCLKLFSVNTWTFLQFSYILY